MKEKDKEGVGTVSAARTRRLRSFDQLPSIHLIRTLLSAPAFEGYMVTAVCISSPVYTAAVAAAATAAEGINSSNIH